MNKISIIILISLLALSQLANAEIYRWTDKDGNVHFGDKPKTTDAEKLNYDAPPEAETNSNNQTSPPSLEELEKLTEELKSSRLKREELRRKQAEELAKQEHDEACKDKRQRVAQLQQEINIALEKRIRETRSSTDRTFDADTYNKKVQLKKVQQELKEDCK